MADYGWFADWQLLIVKSKQRTFPLPSNFVWEIALRVRKAPRVAIISLALAAALIGWSCWTLSDWTLPQIVRGGGDVFRTRILQRYPVGSSEQALISDLREEGFQIKIYDARCPVERPTLGRSQCYSTADYDRPFIIPAATRGWFVNWIGKNGRIAEITANHGADGP